MSAEDTELMKKMNENSKPLVIDYLQTKYNTANVEILETEGLKDGALFSVFPTGEFVYKVKVGKEEGLAVAKMDKDNPEKLTDSNSLWDNLESATAFDTIERFCINAVHGVSEVCTHSRQMPNCDLTDSMENSQKLLLHKRVSMYATPAELLEQLSIDGDLELYLLSVRSSVNKGELTDISDELNSMVDKVTSEDSKIVEINYCVVTSNKNIDANDLKYPSVPSTLYSYPDMIATVCVSNQLLDTDPHILMKHTSTVDNMTFTYFSDTDISIEKCEDRSYDDIDFVQDTDWYRIKVKNIDPDDDDIYVDIPDINKLTENNEDTYFRGYIYDGNSIKIDENNFSLHKYNLDNSSSIYVCFGHQTFKNNE